MDDDDNIDDNKNVDLKMIEWKEKKRSMDVIIIGKCWDFFY